MGLLDEDPSKLLKPADDQYKWDLPYRGMPRNYMPNLPPAGPGLRPDQMMPAMPAAGPPAAGNPGRYMPGPPGPPANQLMPNLPPAVRPDQMMPGPGPQSSTEDPRQTILALFKRFGLT